MRKMYFWGISLAVLFTACTAVTKEEDAGTLVPEGYKILTIEASQGAETRTAYAGDKTFSWSAGDQISVLCNDGSESFWQTFTVVTPAASSSFTATVPAHVSIGPLGDNKKVALYPASDNHEYRGTDNYYYHIPAERDFRTASGGHAETAIPMLAWGDEDDNFAFSNMTGAAKFTFTDIPCSQVKFSFTTHSVKLNGSYHLYYGGQPVDISNSSNVTWSAANAASDAEKTVTYYADVTDGQAVFYLPYATGGIWGYNTLTLSNAETGEELYANDHVNTINITKNKIAVLPAIQIVSGKPSAYGIDWDAVTASNNTSSTYTAIKTLKATADQDYLYLYMEVDPTQLDRTHNYAHYFNVYAAGASGSNSYWSNPNNLTQIGSAAWAVVNGNIAYANWKPYNSSDLLAKADTWYYELRYSRTADAVSAILGPAGTLNIGVELDDTYYLNDPLPGQSSHYYHLQSYTPYGVIPTYGSAMYTVDLPGDGSFSYTSAYGQDWSSVEASENTNATYPALKSMRAVADDDYLYLLLEADPAQLTMDHNFDHQFHLYVADAAGVTNYWGSTATSEFGKESWGVVSGVPSYTNWDSSYSSCETRTVGSSLYYELRISRTHSTTEPVLGNGGTVHIGVVLDDLYVYVDGEGEHWERLNEWVPLGVIPSGTALYPVTLSGSEPPASIAVNQDYTPSTEDIANPERGLYKMIEYKYHKRNDSEVATSETTSTSTSQTDSYDANGRLVLTLFYLFDFVNADHISDVGVQYVRNVLLKVRQNGKKAIVRFAYNNRHPSTWDMEPTLTQIQNHLNDLKQTLIDFEDIIYVVQAGFIGTYGEWYYTTHFGPAAGGVDYTVTQSGGNYSVSGYSNRAAVITALLEAVPSSRQIELRTPEYKACYTQPANLSNYVELEEFGTDADHRLAFHNDAFLYGNGGQGGYKGDMGTFHYDWQKNMWKEQGAYLINGGEAPYSSKPISGMDGYVYANVMAGIYDYHYSYLHHDTGHHTAPGSTDPDDGSTLMRWWHEQGWMTDIKKMLGYRLYLSNATITGDDLNSGTTLNFSLTLKNSGAAPVVNARPMELVLLHDGTPTVLKDNIGDVRLVPSGTVSGTTVTPGTKNYTFTVTLPQNLVSGDQLAIWLPDAAEGLQNKAVYAIRLANNETTWTSGYNVFYTVE